MNKYYDVFIASVGTTPQIVTEALYYFYNQSSKRKFDKIWLLTTLPGLELIEKYLFRERKLEQLEKTLSLPEGSIPLSNEDIILFKDVDGTPLRDVRSTSDNIIEMKTTFNLVESETKNDFSRVVATVAGGRKSMSVSMGLAMQFYGREQDELIHLIVPEAKMNNIKWFFPDDPDDPEQKIEVSRLPYVRIRSFIKGLDISDPVNLFNLAQSRIDDIAPISDLTVNGNVITVEKDTKRTLSPSLMMIFRYLLKRKLNFCTRDDLPICGECTECYVSHSDMISDFDELIAPEYLCAVKENSAYHDNFIEMLDNRKKMTSAESFIEIDQSLRQSRTKLNTAIEKQFKSVREQIYLKPQAIRKSNDKIKYYGIRVDKNVIKFKN